MCGIVGYIGDDQAAPILLSGLEKLEYRGYDSAGVAVYDGTSLQVVKAKGRLKILSDMISGGKDVLGTVGIGHTRWATHANETANQIRQAIADAGFGFLSPSSTNQLFPVLPDYLIEKLQGKYGFQLWEKIDNSMSAIRLVTSWATPESAVKDFIQDFNDFVL